MWQRAGGGLTGLQTSRCVWLGAAAWCEAGAAPWLTNMSITSPGSSPGAVLAFVRPGICSQASPPLRLPGAGLVARLLGRAQNPCCFSKLGKKARNYFWSELIYFFFMVYVNFGAELVCVMTTRVKRILEQLTVVY